MIFPTVLWGILKYSTVFVILDTAVWLRYQLYTINLYKTKNKCLYRCICRWLKPNTKYKFFTFYYFWCCNSKREEARLSFLFSNCNIDKNQNKEIIYFAFGISHLVFSHWLIQWNKWLLAFVIEPNSNIIQLDLNQVF